MAIATIGRYEVIETLARGGMGVVYKARDPLIDRIVAVKTLGFGLSPIEAQAFRKRFAREARSAGRLNHPNIVTIHDMGESDDGAYIAMEFLEGRSLRDVLDTGVVLEPATVAQLAGQVADGLAYAHLNGVVHCDIKPGNIMLLENGTAKITDFGIAMLPTGSRTFEGNVLGSPRYIAPEQVVGRAVDSRSDIFSLGAVLYEMLTGVPPFAAQTIDEILYQVINDQPEAPSVRNRCIPRGFDAIVERALAKDPEARYQHVQEMAAALRPLAEAANATFAPLPPIAAGMSVAPSADRPAARPVGHDTVEMSVPDIPSAVKLVAAAEEKARSSSRPPARRARAAMIGVPLALLALLAWTGYALKGTRVGQPAEAPVAMPAAREGPAVVAAEPAVSMASEPPSPALTSPLPPTAPAAAVGAVAPGPAATPGTPVPAPDVSTVSSPPATLPKLQTPAPSIAAAVRPPPAAPSARLVFAVSPWGEIHVDGRKRGASPPLTELKLAPGKYHVEIRNAGFAPHVETIVLRADAAYRIKYKFQ